MHLYGIPNCSTVKKARSWLDAQQVAYTFHDLKKQAINASTANAWLTQVPWEKLINRSGTTWRALSEAEKHAVVDAASAAALMLTHPTVIKRPVLVNDGQVLAVGFNADHYGTLFMQHPN